MARNWSTRWWEQLIRKPGFWLILLLLTLITTCHYRETVVLPQFVTNLFTELGLSRHSFERILYLAPIIWAGFLIGWKGVVVTSFVAVACMLPRALFISPTPKDALFEISAVFIVGTLVSLTFEALRKERERRIQLGALNRISGVVTQTLDLTQILNSSIESIKDVMNVDIALIFLLDEKAGELTLTAHAGVSERFVMHTGTLKLGEGLNGMVAQTGEPAFVENASKDPRLTKMAVREENIQSQLIVPMKSKGNVMGTVSVAMHSHHQFSQDETDLLIAMANQIGVAIENARLYEQEKAFARQLQTSEERYRQLFENAHDAIWISDMDGNIISANAAANRFEGFTVKDLSHTKIRPALDRESLQLANEIRTRLLRDEPVDQPYEQKVITRYGNEIILRLTTNVVTVDGKAVGFQYIARDVTQEKHMEENLRYYVQQVTMAQEEERKRISRELHDETIQDLTVLSRQLDVLSEDKGLSPDKKLTLEKLRQQTNDIVRGVRRLSQDLRPAALDRLGLPSALEWLASDVSEYSGLPIKVKVIGGDRRLPEDVELVLFRIVQEALRNIWRHAQATQADVNLEFDGAKTRIIIQDNGKGFEVPHYGDGLTKHGKLGLTGMQERARLLGGSIVVESKHGKGTKVTVEVPTYPGRPK